MYDTAGNIQSCDVPACIDSIAIQSIMLLLLPGISVVSVFFSAYKEKSTADTSYNDLVLLF